MYDHLQLVRMYIDPITISILTAANIKCKDIFELFRYFILNFRDIIIHHDIGSMYNLELSSVKHLLYHVVHNIFVLAWTLNKMPAELITPAKIQKEFNSLHKNKIFTITGHGELTPESIATDCKIYSATCNALSYSKVTSSGKGKQRKKSNIERDLLLHASQTEIASYLMVTKADSTGRSKLNPFIELTASNCTKANPELTPWINNLTELIKERNNGV